MVSIGRFPGRIRARRVFRQARRAAVAGVALAPCLVAALQTGVQMSRDSGCCNLWPIGLVLAIAVGGAGADRRWVREPPARSCSPAAARLGDRRGRRDGNCRAVARDHARRAASAGARGYPAADELHLRSGNGVRGAATRRRVHACDGVKLPDVGKFGWTDDGRETIHNLLIVQDHTIRLACPTTVGTFRVEAFSHAYQVPAPRT